MAMNRWWKLRFALASALAVGYASPAMAGHGAVNCCAMPDCQHHQGGHAPKPAGAGVVAEDGGVAAKPVQEPVEAERVYVTPDMRLGFLRGTPEAVPGMGEEFLAVGRGAVMGVDVKMSPAVSLCCKFGVLIAGPGGQEALDADADGDLGAANMYAGIGVTVRFGRGAKAKAVRGDEETRPAAD